MVKFFVSKVDKWIAKVDGLEYMRRNTQCKHFKISDN